MFYLRDIRKANGLTMKELGKRIGLTESAIGLYETGKRTPNYEMLLRLSEALGCGVNDLLYGYGHDAEVNLTEEEKEMLILFRAANQQGRNAAKAVLRAALTEEAASSLSAS